MLTSARFKTNTNPQKPAGVTKCTNSRCLICKHHLITGNSFKFDNFNFKVKSPLNCNLNYVIYTQSNVMDVQLII